MTSVGIEILVRITIASIGRRGESHVVFTGGTLVSVRS